MAKIGRPGLSREKKAELWARWKSGQCASDIARALERTKGAIHHVLAFNGGIAPVPRRRGPLAFVQGEREEISRACGRVRRSRSSGLCEARLAPIPCCLKNGTPGCAGVPGCFVLLRCLNVTAGPARTMRQWLPYPSWS